MYEIVRILLNFRIFILFVSYQFRVYSKLRGVGLPCLPKTELLLVRFRLLLKLTIFSAGCSSKICYVLKTIIIIIIVIIPCTLHTQFSWKITSKYSLNSTPPPPLEVVRYLGARWTSDGLLTGVTARLRVGSAALMGNDAGSTPCIESSSTPLRVGVADPDSLRLPPPPTGGEGQDSRVSAAPGTIPPVIQS